MNWELIRLLFLHEARMLVRARRTVVMAIVLPAIIMPLMLYAQKYSADRRERLPAGWSARRENRRRASPRPEGSG